MDDRASRKQASKPADKVHRLLDELVATTKSTQSDRPREIHASLKALSDA